MIIVMQKGAGDREIGLVIEKIKAAGADGLIVEVHSRPEKALVDGPQSLNFAQLEELMKTTRPIAKCLGREI